MLKFKNHIPVFLLFLVLLCIGAFVVHAAMSNYGYIIYKVTPGGTNIDATWNYAGAS